MITDKNVAWHERLKEFRRWLDKLYPDINFIIPEKYIQNNVNSIWTVCCEIDMIRQSGTFRYWIVEIGGHLLSDYGYITMDDARDAIVLELEKLWNQGCYPKDFTEDIDDHS